jgi:deazaflavin-dependent oxidoreductase (nitroreductase family)
MMYGMPLPEALGRFNARVTNRITRPVARLAPGFAVVVHRGRRSGREYRTPVNAFGRQGNLVVPLTYGPDAQWVRNVLAADGCEVESRGWHRRYCAPAVVIDQSRHLVPPGIRQALGLLSVDHFLVLEPCAAT